MHTLTLREAALTDVSSIQTLIVLSARHLNLAHYTASQIESALTWVFGVDTQLIADGTYYVVMDSERLVGCGGWSRRTKDFGGDHTDRGQNALLDPQTEAAKIRAFFVHPEYARRGIGRRLLDLCEARAGAEGFRLVELVATQTGYTLYSACGYTGGESLNIQIPNGEDFPCIKMSKNLCTTQFK